VTDVPRTCRSLLRAGRSARSSAAVIVALVALGVGGCEQLAHTRNDGSTSGTTGLGTTGHSGASSGSTGHGASTGSSSTASSTGNTGSTSSTSSTGSSGSTGTTATVPGAPTGVAVTIASTLPLGGAWRATVTWQPPASPGSSPLASYTVTATAPSQPSVSATVVGSAASATGFGPLVIDAHYAFTVTATNASGSGPASAPANFDACLLLTPPSFGAPQTLVINSAPRKITLVDLNADGLGDLVFSEGSETSYALASDAGFQRFKNLFFSGNTGGIFAVGDLNGDGLPDVAGTDPSQNTLLLALSGGANTFQQSRSLNLGTGSPAVSNDFYVAIRRRANPATAGVVVGDKANALVIDVVDPIGAFPLITRYPMPGSELSGLTCGRLGGQVDDSVVTVDLNGGTVRSAQGAALGPPTPLPSTTANRGVITGDFNRDGILDLAIGPDFNAQMFLQVLLGLPDAGFGPPSAFPLIGSSSANFGLATADINADGILDLIHANTADGSVGVLLGQRDGGFSPETRVITGLTSPSPIAAGDFTGDGRADLAVGDSAAVIHLYANTFACH
jgi:hypothetical protein